MTIQEVKEHVLNNGGSGVTCDIERSCFQVNGFWK